MRLLPVDRSAVFDRLIDLAPQLFQHLEDLIKPDRSKSNITNYEMMNYYLQSRINIARETDRFKFAVLPHSSNLLLLRLQYAVSAAYRFRGKK